MICPHFIFRILCRVYEIKINRKIMVKKEKKNRDEFRRKIENDQNGIESERIDK